MYMSFVKLQRFTLLDSSTIAVEKLTLPELPPVLRHLQKQIQNTQAVYTVPFAGKLGAASDCYTYSEEEKKKLEEDTRSKGWL